MTGHVKITCGKDAPLDAKVWLDGHEVRGLCSVRLVVDAPDLPRVVLELEPAALEYDGPADLAQIPKRSGRWEALDEEWASEVVGDPLTTPGAP